MPSVPLEEVSAVFELLVEPAVSRLYFWALQATFLEGSTARGGAHLGLQWHPSYPDNRAVNWGGYGESGELAGSVSELPSALENSNTRDYSWEPGIPYRFVISSPETGRWRGTVTNLATGEPTVVRDLFSTGTRLAGPMVWTEAFCRCDDPSVVARWSDFRATTDGNDIPIESIRVNYQSYAQGGCTNTTVREVDGGLLQITGTEREIPVGRLLSLK
ncbi:MAG: hypothetical protein OEM81_04975 [Acidimicrobiia bacterium]|nr:hypothetical protein [Acidimicrobiia bacterium]